MLYTDLHRLKNGFARISVKIRVLNPCYKI